MTAIDRPQLFMNSRSPRSPAFSPTSATSRTASSFPTPPSLTTSPSLSPRTPLTPTSLRDLTHDASRTYPLPPTGHDLMTYFPHTLPACITGKLFEQQERDYFSRAAAGCSSSTSRTRDCSKPAPHTTPPAKDPYERRQDSPQSRDGSGGRSDCPRTSGVDQRPVLAAQAPNSHSSPRASVPSHHVASRDLDQAKTRSANVMHSHQTRGSVKGSRDADGDEEMEHDGGSDPKYQRYSRR